MHQIKSRWVLGLAVFAVTAASYAQWSNPADDVPAYHPSAPLNIHALPSILHGAQLTGPNFRYPWQVHAYQLAARSRASSTSFRAIAAAIAPLATPACAVAMKRRTPPSAPPAPRKASTPTSKTKAGWTPAQIRAGIAKHDYESIDLDKQ